MTPGDENGLSTHCQSNGISTPSSPKVVDKVLKNYSQVIFSTLLYDTKKIIGGKNKYNS